MLNIGAYIFFIIFILLIGLTIRLIFKKNNNIRNSIPFYLAIILYCIVTPFILNTIRLNFAQHKGTINEKGQMLQLDAGLFNLSNYLYIFLFSIVFIVLNIIFNRKTEKFKWYLQLIIFIVGFIIVNLIAYKQFLMK